MYTKILFTVCALTLVRVHGFRYEGDQCRLGGDRGVCVNIRKCPAAIEDIKHHRNPEICSFSGSDPIVCCVQGAEDPTTSRPPVATTQRPKPSTTTEEHQPMVYDYREDSPSDCPPIAANLTAAKTGRKAWDKCLEYQETLVYPCEGSAALALGADMVRANHCQHTSTGLIVGGEDAGQHEFPHMVQLGYGTDPATASWVCGGSLISEKFVLTAGHCLFSREFGTVTFVKTGSYKRSEQIDLNSIYRIKQILKHPNYKPPLKYNDLTLLETEKAMKLSQFVVPACLDTGVDAIGELGLATGWGLTTHRGTVSDVLQKVTLQKFTSKECYTNFGPERNMPKGFQESTQICYGHKTESKDTCQGDSGGPMQIYNKKIDCMYTIVGLTSFGKACGLKGVPAIYTRVAAYTDWIESVVWP